MKQFAHIIPILKLSPQLHGFDYEIPEFLQHDLQVGHIVHIPFRNRESLGIVKDISETPPQISQNIKSISRLYTPETILPTSYLNFLLDVAKYYHISPALLAYHALPSFPKQSRVRKFYQKKEQKRLQIKKDRIQVLSDTSKQIDASKNSLLVYQLEQEALSLIIKEIQKQLEQKKQVLFLVPYVSDIYRIIPFLEQYTKATIVPMHKRMAKGEFFKNWQHIACQETDIVIGTRLGIFAPLDNLGCIIIHNEEHAELKQYDMNPRYDARILSELKPVPVLYTSQSPRTQTQFTAKEHHWNILHIPRLLLNTQLIDLSAKRRQGEFGLLSIECVDEIQNQLEHKKSSFLYLNKKGIDQGLYCKDCKQLLQCQNCDGVLRSETDLLYCPKCFTKQQKLVACPHCHGNNVISLGAGTQKIEKELNKLFPDTQVYRIDKESNIQPLQFPCIIIGTDFAMKNYIDQFKNEIGMICALELDMYTEMYDYRYSEKQFASIMYLFNMALETQSQFLIQSSTIDHETLQMALQQRFDAFYTRELENRKILGYPPFGHLFKIICKDTEKEQMETRIEEIIDKLTPANKNGKVEFIGDYELKPTAKYLRHAIIFKTDEIHSLEVPMLPEHYQLDIDYETV